MYPRPTPEFFYRKAVRDYECHFRRNIPQWVQALGNSKVCTLVQVSTRLRWKLPTKILVEGEEFSGPESLWSQKQIRLDFLTESKNKGAFVPNNPQDLPIDPAEAAMIGNLKKVKENGKSNV